MPFFSERTAGYYTPAVRPESKRGLSLNRSTSANADRMSAAESRAAFSLAGIFSFRMLGLFMIYPVFALYADHLPGHSDHVGMALGVYGLTQALLQIPFGFLSDQVGRKPMITMGLLIFAVGSVVAALATTLWRHHRPD